MNLLILCAIEREADPLRKRLGCRWERIAGFRGFRACGALIAVSGVGGEKARSAAGRILSSARPDAILSTGYCGATRPELRAGDLVVSTELVDLRAGKIFNPAPSLLRDALETAAAAGLRALPGRTATVERVVAEKEDKGRLGREEGTHAVDMESAVLAAQAEEAGIPFFCVRAVSDASDEEIPAEILEMKGRGRPSFLLLRPAALARGLRLWRSSRRASRSLALFLEAFLKRAAPDGPSPGEGGRAKNEDADT